jgi:hypothetical protein
MLISVLVFHTRATGNEKGETCSILVWFSGWWLVLVCSERKVPLLVAGLFREKNTVGWWLISQVNRATLQKSTR